MIQQSDSITNSTATYVPDKLNRLTSFSSAFGAATYGYDAWGNLASHTNTAGPGYTYSLTMTPQNRVSQAGSTDSAFLYDASGNVLKNGLNGYSYDAEGRLHAVNGATTYVYGPEGERVATVQSGTVNTEYLYGIDGTLTTELAPGGKLVRGLLYGGGMHLADYTQDGKTVFHLSDEVGSLVNTIDQTGAAIESCAANPFGENLNCSPSVDYTETHFTDKKRDQESGLDYFGARYYGSTFGRFMSPDWAMIISPIPYGDISNPQSLNLYSYVQNNPLSRVDANGHVQLCGPSITSTNGNGDTVVNANCADLPDPPSFLQQVQRSFSQIGASLSAVISRSLGSSGGPRAGRRFSPTDKKVVLQRNAAENGGNNVCENCGQPVIPGQQGQPGVTPADNEANVDHIHPRSGSGDADPETNGQLLCRACNLGKSNSLPTTGEPVEPLTPIEPVIPIEPIVPIAPF